MIKKQIYIYFLFLACSIQLGHSLFPHTHAEKQHHHGNHHHDEEHFDENGLSHFFCHIQHTSDVFSTSHFGDVLKIVKEVSNQIFVGHSTSFFTDFIAYSYKKEVVQNKEPLVFISPHLHSLQFRGPPTFFS
jgi:hypothetical protein